MSLAILFHWLCAQHVSDINISIFRSLRLCWWITTSVVLFSVRCVLELLLWLIFGGVRFAGWSRNNSSNTQRTENKTTDVVIHQHSRRLLKMDTLISETCWAHNKWNKIASDIKLVFHSSTITALFMKVLPQLVFLVLVRHSVEIPSRRTAVSYGAYRHKAQTTEHYLCALHNSDPWFRYCQLSVTVCWLFDHCNRLKITQLA